MIDDLREISHRIILNGGNESTYSPILNYLISFVFACFVVLCIWLFCAFCNKLLTRKVQQWKQKQTHTRLFYRILCTQLGLIHKSFSATRIVFSISIFSHLISVLLKILGQDILKHKDPNFLFAARDIDDSCLHLLEKLSVFFNNLSEFIVHIFLIVLVAIWCLRILQKTSDILFLKTHQLSDDTNTRILAKQKTLSAITHYVLKITISLIACFYVLQNIGINISALLATAGVASVAIGFGAQNLVKDFIAGFFILFEDQFTVGDVLEIMTPTGMLSGNVEKMTLRMVCIRSNEGSVTIIPNADIRCVKNYSTDWSRLDFKLLLPLQGDIQSFIPIFRQEIEKFYQDFQDRILTQPDIRPVEKIMEFENQSVSCSFRVFFKTSTIAHRIQMEQELNIRMIRALKTQEFYSPHDNHRSLS